MVSTISKVLLFVIVLAADPVPGASSGIPPELAGCKVFRIWHFDSDAEGWVPDRNVGHFTLDSGILRFVNTGADPWIVNRSPGGFEASGFSCIGIKMRSSVSGTNEIYFSTDKHPGPASGTVVRGPAVGGRDFVFHEYDMSQCRLWDGKVNLLRFDLANGPREAGAQVEIDWIAVYQPAKPKIAVGMPYAGRDRDGVFVCVPVTNARGPKSDEPLTVTCGGDVKRMECPQPLQTATATFRIPKPVSRVRIEVRMEEKPVFEALVAVPFRSLGQGNQMAAKHESVLFPRTREIPEASLLWKSGATAGVFRPMGALGYVDGHGVQHYVELCPDYERRQKDGTIVLGAAERIEGGRVSFVWKLSLPRGSGSGTVTCTMTTDTALNVTRFEGPRLLAGEYSFGRGKIHGLFPGIEYLERNEPSSALRHIGPRFADRRAPDPYKITVPVMAVETDKGTVGVSWNPLQKWAARQTGLPCAGFDSPNTCHGAANHLMSLFVPSIPGEIEENAFLAARPYRLEPGQSLTISFRFFLKPGGRIEQVIPDYYRVYGLPKPPPVVHGVDGNIALCLRAYTDSLYFPDQNKWKSHFGLGQTPWFNPPFAAAVLAESLRTHRPELARKVNIKTGTQLSSFTGTTLDWFSEESLKHADALADLLEPDGSQPYRASSEIREKVKELAYASGSSEQALGDDGEKNSGLTLRTLHPVLQQALMTGRDSCVKAAIRGLAHLNSCSVPRGSQTWEVHAHAPDILAAGRAVEANVMGYHLTGDRAYLNEARRWAYTGLPFIYAWTPPAGSAPIAVFHASESEESKAYTWSKAEEFYQDTRRRVNPGATIPVFGTTFYVEPWFGRPVQWCGLAWARAVQGYSRCSRDPVLQRMADAVYASATQQQFDKGWAAGTYPDAWDVRGNTASSAFIAPDLILDCALSLKREKRPSVVDFAGFSVAGARSCLSSYGLVTKLGVKGRTLTARLKFYAGQDLWACVSRCSRPVVVKADGRRLSPAADLNAAASGFYYDAANRALHIKIRPRARDTAVEIKW